MLRKGAGYLTACTTRREAWYTCTTRPDASYHPDALYDAPVRISDTTPLGSTLNLHPAVQSSTDTDKSSTVRLLHSFDRKPKTLWQKINSLQQRFDKFRNASSQANQLRKELAEVLKNVSDREKMSKEPGEGPVFFCVQKQTQRHVPCAVCHAPCATVE